ncbi:MAG: alpha/beta hydrolase [Desulfovibrio sp.]|nr:alpha/beta hydrolase [Desulfovibrio sp.]
MCANNEKMGASQGILSALLLSLMISLLVIPQGIRADEITQDRGLRLESSAKQQYIKQTIAALFHQGASKEKPFLNVPEGWEYTSFQLDKLPVERLFNPSATSRRVVLQLHGGGYLYPLNNIYRRLALKKAKLLDAREAWMVNYRLAPSHSYPDALDDAAKVYAEILRRGTAPEDILVSGDSAGGNLALALCLKLRDERQSLPGLLHLLSPWATLETDSPSRRINAERDSLLGRQSFLHELVSRPSPYAGGLDLKDPRLSPIYADLSGLPPMLVQAGGFELLLDDALQLALKAAQDGVAVTLTVYPEMPHVFAINLPELQESVDAFRELRDFVLRYAR